MVRFSKGKTVQPRPVQCPNFRRRGSSGYIVQYPKSINVTFKDGKKWEVRMRPN